MAERQKDPNETPNKRKLRKASIDDMLVKGEEIVDQAVISQFIYWHAAAVLIFAVLVSVFVVFELGAVLALAAVCMFIYATIKKEILLLVITNKRVLVRYGILQVDVVDIRFSKIESLELERMIPGYLMGYANVVLMGTGQRYVVIPFVGNAPELRRAYNRLTLAEDEELGDQDE